VDELENVLREDGKETRHMGVYVPPRERLAATPEK